MDYTRNRKTAFSAAVQFITGFNFLNYHQSLVKKSQNDADGNDDLEDYALCRLCRSASESTFHMLTECEKHTLTRYMIWGTEMITPPYDIKMTQIQEFLRMTQMPTFQDVLNYTVGMPKARQDK